MTLLRRVLGETLRGQRLRQRRTLREVSGAARVSLGYLSEVERGQKEASSELLASICEALDVRMSDVLREVSDAMRRTERVGELARMTTPTRTLVPAGVGGGRPDDTPRSEFPPAPTGTPRTPIDSSDRGSGRATPPVDTADLETVDLLGSLRRAAELGTLGPDGLGSAGRVPDGLGSAGRGSDGAVLDSIEIPVPTGPEPALGVPGLEQARFERLDESGLGRAGLGAGGIALPDDLDGVDLAELETGDGLGEVEILLGLTDLLCRPDGNQLAAAGAGAAA
jgi:transcriptional regulator with XRE-family HTH domain